MIVLRRDSDTDWLASQAAISPSIYLDHWALMDFAIEESSATRLTKYVRAHEGTLLLSWMSLLELGVVTDEEQRTAMASLLSNLAPHLAFIHSDPAQVIRKEDAFWGGRSDMVPHLDMELLKTFVVAPASTGNMLDPAKLI